MSTADAPRAILTTRWDIFTAGGGTFLILPLLLFPFAISRNWSPSDLLWIPVIINYPHFMASYRLLYTKRNIRKHPIVAIWVPLALIGYILFTLSVATTDRSYVMPFLMVGSAYLAVHYTGQAWGVMVTYSFVDGDPFEPRERRLIRASLYIMMAWHVLWAIELPYKTPGYPLGTSGAQELYFAAAFAVGTYGLYLRQRRSGRRRAWCSPGRRSGSGTSRSRSIRPCCSSHRCSTPSSTWLSRPASRSIVMAAQET